MNEATVLFGLYSDRSDQAPYVVTTIASEHGQEFTKPRDLLDGARLVFEEAMRRSLANQRGYPLAERIEMLAALDWVKGHALLQQQAPEVTKFTMNEETWHLLPEMIPLFEEAPGRWLDTLSASFRTLGMLSPPPVARTEELSLAILYEVLDDGEEMLCRFDGKTVSFRISRLEEKRQLLDLPVAEFVRRVLLHVPPTGYRVVRACGLYHQYFAEQLETCRPDGLRGSSNFVFTNGDSAWFRDIPLCRRQLTLPAIS